MFAEFKRRSQHVLPAITTSFALLLSTTALSHAAGLPYGAAKEEFIAALADMDPVELVMQVTGSPGDENSLASEQYVAAVTEWSGGKIQGKVVYGNAILAGNTAPAVADGRITFGGVIAQYDPSNFPISAGLVDLSFVSNSSPIAGALQTWGTLMEASGTEEAIEEQRLRGRAALHPGRHNGQRPVLQRASQRCGKAGRRTDPRRWTDPRPRGGRAGRLCRLAAL